MHKDDAEAAQRVAPLLLRALLPVEDEQARAVGLTAALVAEAKRQKASLAKVIAVLADMWDAIGVVEVQEEGATDGKAKDDARN